jgi:hypothetical protein
VNHILLAGIGLKALPIVDDVMNFKGCEHTVKAKISGQ